jgi:hypothetical protein
MPMPMPHRGGHAVLKGGEGNWLLLFAAGLKFKSLARFDGIGLLVYFDTG